LINSLKFRPFNNKDISDILKIYNFHISNGMGSFEEKEVPYETFKDLCKNILKLNLPFIVCEKNKKVIAFTYLNKFRNKSGYRYAFENSIYVDINFTGMGIGSELLKKLIEVSKRNTNIKSIIAVIGSNNSKASIKIHKKNRFKMIGTLKQVGFKKNQWLDSIYMQKIFNEKN